MKLLLLSLTICALLLLYGLETHPPNTSIQQATATQGAVTLSGFAHAGKLCNASHECISIKGLKELINATGSVVVTGEVVKKGGEAVLFVHSIQ